MKETLFCDRSETNSVVSDGDAAYFMHGGAGAVVNGGMGNGMMANGVNGGVNGGLHGFGMRVQVEKNFVPLLCNCTLFLVPSLCFSSY